MLAVQPNLIIIINHYNNDFNNVVESCQPNRPGGPSGHGFCLSQRCVCSIVPQQCALGHTTAYIALPHTKGREELSLQYRNDIATIASGFDRVLRGETLTIKKKKKKKGKET